MTAESWIAIREMKIQILENAEYLYGCKCRVITVKKPTILGSHRALIVPITQRAPLHTTPESAKLKALEAGIPSEPINQNILACGTWSTTRYTAVEALLTEVEKAAHV